jgi:hypothetical protein
VNEEWEYAIHSKEGTHLWPFIGFEETPAGTTFEECERALDGNDPDFWDATDHIVKRRVAGPWWPYARANRG